MKYKIDEEAKVEIENARKKNHDKQIDRRLRVLERVHIKRASKIIARVMTDRKMVSSLS